MTATCPRAVICSSATASPAFPPPSGGTSRLGMQTSSGNLPVSPDPFPRSASRTGAPRLPQTPSTGPLRGRTLRVSLIEPQIGLADADDVAAAQPARAVEPSAVQVRPVRRAEVLDPDAVLSWLEAGMARGGVLVSGDRDVVLIAPADRQLGRVQLEVVSLAQVRACDNNEPSTVQRRAGRLQARSGRRREDEALLGKPQVAASGSHDPPDEDVEEHQERDLEDEQDLVDRGRVEDHHCSRPKVKSVEPRVIVSPSSSFARLTRLPLTSIPFVDPRSTTQYEAPSWRSSAWRLETLASASWMSHPRTRPMTTRCCFTS